MATSTPVIVTLAEYLETVYRPDRDWIDGETKERNIGEQPHASVQGFLTRVLGNRAAELGIRVFPEQRVQASARHYRIADVCIVRRATPMEPIVRTPPLLCIEILSKDDSLSEILDRVEGYLSMGVPTVWVVDPRRRRAYTAAASGALEPAPTELTVPNTEIRIPLPDIFAELDEMEAQP
ncbi:MAG: Uma2 family endonuclease [Acidobacteriaceae bacterium]|jgi:Uma2 family endonuclease